MNVEKLQSISNIPLYKGDTVNNLFSYCIAWPDFMHNSTYFIIPNFDFEFLGYNNVEFNNIYKNYESHKDVRYIFPIIFSKWILFENLDKIFIPANVLQDVLKNKCKIMLMNVFEGWQNFYWKKAINFLKNKFNITDSSIIVVNGNASKFSQFSNHIYYNHWEKHFYYDLENYNTADFKYKKNKKYKFICLNRRPQPYRVALVTLLENLEKDGILTFNTEVDNDDSAFYKSRIKNFEINYPRLYKKFKKINLESRLPKQFDDGINAQFENPTRDRSPIKFYDSYLHIVPETYHINEEEQIFFSEKIFKPIIYFQPFVLVSQTNSLKTFKTLGYKTFDRWIDESYDNIVNNEDRLIEIYKIVKQFINKSDKELDNIILEMKPILEHNFKNLINRSFNLDYNFKKNLSEILYA
jgi:hypothetical protein